MYHQCSQTCNHKSGPKDKWPNLLHTNVLNAQQIIQQEAQDARVVIIPHGTVVTADYIFNRVRIFYNTLTGLVTQIPTRG